MKNKFIKRFKQIWRIVQICIPGLIFLVFWQFYVGSDSRLRFLYGSPSLIWRRLTYDLSKGDLLWDVAVTAVEALLGFLLGCFTGTLLGLVLWASISVARVARPYIIILGAIPIFAIAPMTIIWFGTDLFSKVMIAALSTVLVSLVQAYEGAQNVDPDLISLMRTFGASKLQIYQKVIMPSTLVWVIASLRLNIGFALLGAFIGEFISSEVGLGHYILRGSGLYDVPQVLAGVLCLIVMSLLMSFAVGLLERVLLPWKYRRKVVSNRSVLARSLT